MYMPFTGMQEMKKAVRHRIRRDNATSIRQRADDILLSFIRIVLGLVPCLVESTRLMAPTKNQHM